MLETSRDVEEASVEFIIPDAGFYCLRSSSRNYSREKTSLEVNKNMQRLVQETSGISALYRELGYSPSAFFQIQKYILEIKTCFSADSLVKADNYLVEKTGLLTNREGFLELLDGGCEAPSKPSHLVSEAMWDLSTASAELIRTALVRSGDDAVNLWALRSFVVSRLGSVEARELPPDKWEKKRRLDCLLFMLVEDIPSQHRRNHPFERENSNYSKRAWIQNSQQRSEEAIDKLAATSKEYLDISWAHTPDLGYQIVRTIMLCLIDLHRVEWRSLSVKPQVSGMIVFVLFGIGIAVSTRALEVCCFAALVALGFWAGYVLDGSRKLFLFVRLQRLAKEVDSKVFSGSVIANRLEVLYWLGLQLPSSFSAVFGTFR